MGGAGSGSEGSEGRVDVLRFAQCSPGLPNYEHTDNGDWREIDAIRPTGVYRVHRLLRRKVPRVPVSVALQ